jgi:hypothetical protein
LDEKKHGYGIYYWNDGRRYEGNWFEGKYDGKVKFVQPDGSVKVGIWIKRKRESDTI